jgi:monoamine oxidase
VDSSPPPWDNTPINPSMTCAVERDFEKSVDCFYARLDVAARMQHDRAASELLDPNCRWNPLIDAISTYVSGVELDKISVIDGENYDDTETDWRVVEGYGTLISRLATKLPIHLNTTVQSIDHSRTRIKISTSGGSLDTDAVIVTVPTNVIATGALRFVPDLPRKCDAAAHLPLGVANKIFFSLDRAEEFERDTNLYGSIDRVATGNYYARISGLPLVEGFFGGALARDLEREGFAAFADFAMNELVDVMGSAFRQRLHPIVSTAWSSDPFSLGSYSYAEPGHAGDRAVLAAPVDGRIFFAGEACSKYHFSTAHGAYRSGRKAAMAVLQAFRGI